MRQLCQKVVRRGYFYFAQIGQTLESHAQSAESQQKRTAGQSEKKRESKRGDHFATARHFDQAEDETF